MKKRDFTNFNAVDVLLFAWEKRTYLIIISVLAAVISTIASFTITELYRSTVILFPAPAVSVAKSLLSSNYSARQGLLNFGEEEQAEQLLQVLNSEEIRGRIIQKYNLREHYEIDSTAKFPMTTLYNKYKSHISFKRTEYQSVVIEVLDKDPQMAADIANDIADLVDTAMAKIQHDRAIKALNIVGSEYNELQHQIKFLEDSLTKIRKLGVIDYETQAEVFNNAYAIALSEGNTKAITTLENKLKILAEYGGAYVSIIDFLEYQKEQLSDIKAKYAEAKVEAEQTLPYKFVVESAYKAERKAYPKKSIIILSSTISAFLLCLVLLLIIDYLKNRTK